MRIVGAILALCLTTASASAQEPKAAPSRGPAEHYAAMLPGARTALLTDLIWSGDYNGTTSGDFGERAVDAVRAFQQRSNARATGILNPLERAELQAAAKAAQERVGWRLVTDIVTGARLGVPGKLVPQSAPGKTGGTRWSAKQGNVQVETFRIGDTTLPALFEAQKKEPERKIEYNALRKDFFVLAGLQGLKKFYTRVTAADGELRGMTVMYDQALHTTMEPVVIAMSSAFAAFPSAATAATARARVEYATGVVVSQAGHIATDRRAVDACSTLVVAGIGDAERVAENDDLALIRVHGATVMTPLTLVSGDIAELSLAGIADPQMQGGGSAILRQGARRTGHALSPTPPPGFAGAAALDARGRLAGIVALKPQAALIPADAVRKLLAANNVVPMAIASADAAAGPQLAGESRDGTSIVRVICVRK